MLMHSRARATGIAVLFASVTGCFDQGGHAGSRDGYGAMGSCIGSLAGGGTQLRSTTTGRTCQRNPVHVQSNCAGFALVNGPHAIDGHGETYAALVGNGSATVAALAQSGVVFPAGSEAGALLLFAQHVGAASLVVSTYLGGVLRESQPVPVPVNYSGTATEPRPYTFKTLLDFDEVELVIELPDAWTQAVQIHEFCSST